MKRWDHQGMDRLRKGRVSIPGARYFTTICTEGRKPGLNLPEISEAFIGALRDLHRAENLDLRCATVMPDHVHLLFILGETLSFSRTIGKLKANTGNTLARWQLTWQKNFHDHRLRQNNSMESFARYIFLNPYRKGLLQCRESWPWWVCNRDYQPEFLSALEQRQYPPETWLRSGSSANELIAQDMEKEVHEETSPHES